MFAMCICGDMCINIFIAFHQLLDLYVFVHIWMYVYMYVSMNLSLSISISLVYLYLSIHLYPSISIYLSLYIYFTHLSIYLSISISPYNGSCTHVCRMYRNMCMNTFQCMYVFCNSIIITHAEYQVIAGGICADQGCLNPLPKSST